MGPKLTVYLLTLFRPAVQFPLLTADAQGGDVAVSSRHFPQKPASGFCGIGPRRTQRVRLLGNEGYVELAQGKGQAVSGRLDVRLFPGPAAKEPFNSLVGGQSRKLALLVGGKEAAGDGVQIEIAANLFDIDTDVEEAGQKRKHRRHQGGATRLLNTPPPTPHPTRPPLFFS